MLIVTMAAKDGSFEFDYTAQYDVIEPLSRIELTMWAFEKHFVPAGRRVVVTFVDNGSEWVVVTEVFDADDVHKYDMQIAWRQAILENFKKYVESV
jgi:uncharacterized protein YndB with AHSA1/START domain